MLKARLFVASCLATVFVAVPLGAPASAQEQPQFNCSLYLGDIVFIPGGWTIWDLVVSDGYTWTIRGDIPLRVANELVSSWAGATTAYVDCVKAYAEAVVADAGATADSLLACVTAAAAPLLQSDPLTSRYVEAGLDGIVHVHLGAVIDDSVALWNCNGIFVIPD